MTPERRRRPGILAAIVADPWRKLLALGLATLLWFFIDSRIMRTVVRSLPLVTVGAESSRSGSLDRLAVALPLDRVVQLRFLDGEQPIDRVEVILTGPRFQVAPFAKGRLELKVTSFLGLDWESRTSVEFTAADVVRDQLGLENIAIELVPPRIRLDVERIASRPVQLNLDQVEVVDTQFLERLRRETAEFAPKEAVVLGPAIGIDRWTRGTGKLFRATIDGTGVSGNDRQVTVPLEILGGQEHGLRFQSQPFVTMQVKPQTTNFELDLPILVDDLALPVEMRGVYQPDAKTRVVRVAAGGELRARLVNMSEGGDLTRLREWAAANLRLLVHIPRPEGSVTMPPELARPARLLPVGRSYENIERNECLLVDPVVVNLRRQP